MTERKPPGTGRESFIDRQIREAQERGVAGPVWAIAALNDAATGPSFGPLDDNVYVDRDFWEGCGYDFAGGIESFAPQK